MSSRAAPRPSIWRTLVSARVRAVLTLGILLGFGAVGTSAYWTDQATVSIGPITSGTLDLVLSPTSAAPAGVNDPGYPTVGQGGVWSFPVVEIDEILPGESVAMDIFFHNEGTTPLTFTGSGQTTTNDFGGKLLISTTPDAEKGVPTGTKAGGNRKGSCVGGSANWWVKHPISTTPKDVTTSNTPVTLQPGSFRRVCMLVEFDPSAGNELQNTNTVISADFTAVQLP